MSVGPSRWLYPLTGRCKRPALVKEGCLVLEHEGTGRFYVTESLSVSEEADKQLKLLVEGKHPCKLFNELVGKDTEIRVTEHPCKPKTTRKKLYEALLVSSTDYLCLNPEIYDLHKRKRRRRSNPKGA